VPDEFEDDAEVAGGAPEGHGVAGVAVPSAGPRIRGSGGFRWGGGLGPAPARRPGELSGKIAWPSDPENPNFPALMIHESVQDKDFSLIKVGDPLFVAHDKSIVPYDGSHGT